MSIFDIFKSKKQKNSAAGREEFLRSHGRITDAVITDSETNEDGKEIVSYLYSVQGVDFESSEILTEEQMRNPLQYAPGAKIGVRFDPKNHGNSMLV
jgi:hypothetical protein